MALLGYIKCLSGCPFPYQESPALDRQNGPKTKQDKANDWISKLDNSLLFGAKQNALP